MNNCECKRQQYTNNAYFNPDEGCEVFEEWYICVDCGAIWENGIKTDQEPYNEDSFMPLSHYKDEYEDKQRGKL